MTGKAQREFRKRREARVRDLEERCRRFDQMGLEANVELQRMARNLKEENEALRGFVIRIGYGNMMPTILDGIGNNNGPAENSFQPAFAGGFGDNSDTGKGTDEGRGMFQQQPQQQQHDRRSSSNKTPNSAPANRTRFSDTLPGQSWSEVGFADKKSDDKIAGSPSSEATSESSRSAPLLSLSLHHRSSDANKAGQQTQPDFTTGGDTANRSRMMSNNNNAAINNLLGQMNSQMGDHNDGSGMAGSAMLSNFATQSPRSQFPISGQNSFAPYSVPQRIQQNDALLNPNPIPFAFNLSNEPPQPGANWWEQMGGGRFTPGTETLELDEKAQAVAAAQANNGGPQSPFDLSAFLQGGMTPGGGYNFGGFSSSQDDAQVKKEQDASGSSGGTFKEDTDHMRTFVRLLEQKVAEREAKTVASLGFQPPSQDPSKRQSNRLDQTNERPKVTFASALSPSGVYSRLSEHPAFLSTDARELEELVDAVAAGAARSPSEQKAGQLNRQGGVLGSSNNSFSSSPRSMKGNANGNARSSSQSSGSTSSNPNSSNRNSNSDNGSVAVDERIIDRLLGILDQKRMPRSIKAEPDRPQQQQLSMAMT
jgi:hypothetical protein